jgi:serine/arginine repetitive matrix protein 2
MSVSRPRFREASVAASEGSVYFPGGWVGTPKRKRQTLAAIEQSPAPATATKAVTDATAQGPNWGVKEWKKLEKIHRAEREAWMKEREVKNMPSPGSMSTSLIGWSWGKRKSVNSPQEVKVKEWDIERVVERFMAENGGRGADWTR